MTEPAHPQPRFTVETAKVLAEVAHNRQKDKLKRPYREHVLAVGDALADFDDDVRIAGYLHDIAEDTPMTRQALMDCSEFNPNSLHLTTAVEATARC